MANEQGTSFSEIYKRFLSKITEDMYMELNEEDTRKLLKELLISAISFFEFPRVSLSYSAASDTEDACGCGIEYYFDSTLNYEEKDILATYMIVQWIGQQLASVENTRMKYSGSDFKFTSQANHMQKLKELKESYKAEGFHLQRLYKRRIRDTEGIFHSTMSTIVEPPDSYKEGSHDY